LLEEDREWFDEFRSTMEGRFKADGEADGILEEWSGFPPAVLMSWQILTPDGRKVVGWIGEADRKTNGG
jgi:hypothetical protein